MGHPPYSVEVQLKTYAKGVGSWRRPTKSVSQLTQAARFPAGLLATATWDALPTLSVYEQVHGNRLKVREGKTDPVRKPSPDEVPKIARWAYGWEPIREGGTRRRPPIHLLNISKRMMSYWRRTPDYAAARQFVLDVCRIIAAKSQKRESRHHEDEDDFTASLAEMFSELSCG